MCIPFQYVNITAAQQSTTDNILTIQPEIHAEPSKPLQIEEEIDNDDDSSENDTDNENANKVEEPESPKILNTDHETLTQVENVPDYTNVQVAASEEIARNFGVTLKKLPAPPVPPRCEFNFAAATTTAEKDGDEWSVVFSSFTNANTPKIFGSLFFFCVDRLCGWVWMCVMCVPFVSCLVYHQCVTIVIFIFIFNLFVFLYMFIWMTNRANEISDVSMRFAPDEIFIKYQTAYYNKTIVYGWYY